MKRLLTFLALTCAAAASFGATLSPVQLLNPTGSTSGQAIVSTGASTAPAWGNVTATALAAQAANTVVANVTGSSASPTAFAMPSCSASGNALNWTSGTGFTCATGYALLASPTFTGTVTTAALTATGAITPSQTAGIVGTNTNNNANAGSVGEYVCAQVTNGGSPSGCLNNSSTPVSLTSGTVANVAAISLTAGDWMLCGNILTLPAGSTTQSTTIAAISMTSAALPPATATNGGAYAYFPFAASGAGQSIGVPTGCMRQLISTTTSYYLVVDSIFAVSTNTVIGYLWAGRRR